jgi:L-lactate dehydrogenase complex protein LldG
MVDSKRDMLLENLAAVGAKPAEAVSVEHLNDVVSRIISDSAKIYCPRETDLEKGLALDNDKVVPDCRNADVGIEEVFGAIAETGAIVCVSASGRNLEASLVPGHHVAMVDRNHIFETLEDFFALVSDDPPGNITLITGPSRTADIELTLTVGVHGPKRLDVIVI